MHRLTNLAIGSRQMQILLLAGDDEDFAYLRDLLVRAGEEQIALNHAHSFEEALVLLKQTTYDLVLCDYKSANGAALRLLHELREQGLGAQVIFLSDFVNDATVEAAIRTGAGRCCQKPGVCFPRYPPRH
jgi:DNA-binding NarL/FixJ family response regulator